MGILKTSDNNLTPCTYNTFFAYSENLELTLLL